MENEEHPTVYVEITPKTHVGPWVSVTIHLREDKKYWADELKRKIEELLRKDVE